MLARFGPGLSWATRSVGRVGDRLPERRRGSRKRARCRDARRRWLGLKGLIGAWSPAGWLGYMDVVHGDDEDDGKQGLWPVARVWWGAPVILCGSLQSAIWT